MEIPQTTLILLNYNNSQFVKNCLDSVVRYKKNYYEIIFVDDCSTDVSSQEYHNIIDDFSELHLKTFFNSDNCGVKHSLLNILDFVVSDYIQLLATDDFFGCSNILPGLTGNENDVYISGGLYIDEVANIIGRYNNCSLKSPILKDLLYYSNPIKAPGIIACKNLVKIALQKTDVDFEDWPILRESISNGGKIISNEKSIVCYRQHAKSLSSKLNADRVTWLSNQILLFLKESLSYKTSYYTRFMIYLQSLYISSGFVMKACLKVVKFLDFKRVIFALGRNRPWL